MFECCVEIRGSFSQYLDGECDRETRRSVQFHLNHCVSCREELLRWRDSGRLPDESLRRLQLELDLEERGLPEG